MHLTVDPRGEEFVATPASAREPRLSFLVERSTASTSTPEIDQIDAFDVANNHSGKIPEYALRWRH